MRCAEGTERWRSLAARAERIAMEHRAPSENFDMPRFVGCLNRQELHCLKILRVYLRGKARRYQQRRRLIFDEVCHDLHDSFFDFRWIVYFL